MDLLEQSKHGAAMIPANTIWIITDSNGRFIEAWRDGDKVNKRCNKIAKQILNGKDGIVTLRVKGVQLK